MADESQTPKYKVEDELYFIRNGEITKETVTSIPITYGKHGMANILYNFSYNGIMLIEEEHLSDSAKGLCKHLLK